MPLRGQQTQEAPEAPTTGTIQGTVKDLDGNPIESARILFKSSAEGITSVARSGKNGAYSSEALLPGEYSVTAEGPNALIASSRVTFKAGETATADFKLEPINPEPRLDSRVAAARLETQPSNGRNPLELARAEPGTQLVDGAILEAGRSGYQALSIDSQYGRTVHYDIDEVEAMDETKGAAIANLPAEGVRDFVVTRAVPEVFQSLNARGSVRYVTRSGADEWHGDVFGRFRNKRSGVSGFPSDSSGYSRQQYGLGVGGALIKDKAFLFVGAERSKQDGDLPFYQGFPFIPGASLRDAYFRENMVTARLDYQVSENAKWFSRFNYDNANQIGPTQSFAGFRNQVNVPSAVFGLDWNRGHFAHSGRFGYQKLVNTINPVFGNDSLIFPGAPFHQQIGSFESGPSVLGPRQTIQRDFFGRYDSSVPFHDRHTLRYGGAIHYITQGDFYAPGAFGPSVTSSNGIDTINAIFNDPNPSFPPLFPGDPRGAAGNPLNYPVGTVMIYNGLGNFSEHSAFDRHTGGHTDTRLELYAADTFHLFPNLNITVGVNYARDTGRTDSDLPSVPTLDQFGNIKGLGNRVSQPNWNFAPQAGVAWDPGRHGRTIVRASGGMFFDNFLFQNIYQDRISRLSQGQYFRSLTLCPNGSVLFPDGSTVSATSTGVDIETGICGQPIGVAAPAIEQLQTDFLAAQQAVASGPNVYALPNTNANFGGLLASNFRTPRIVHMTAGFEHHFGEHTMFSIDYVREVGTQFPLGIDTNHVGDIRYLTDGSNPDPAANTYLTELGAINATLLKNPLSAGCPLALAAGSSSQLAVNCYIASVPGASIVDFARNGLDSSNAFCGPFPCAALGLRDAAFGGINPAVGSNVMYFPSGRTEYNGFQIAFRTAIPLRAPGIRRFDLGANYTYSKYESNVAMANGGGGDYTLLTRAEDYVSPHVGHFGASGVDRRNMFTFTPSWDLPRGARLTMIAQVLSPLPLTARLPQMDGGGTAGEIFRTDATGDGTVGDLVPGTGIGGLGGYSGNDLQHVIANYNSNYSNHLTPAGQRLVASQLFTASQLLTLGASYPVLEPVPGHYATAKWLKTMDVRFSWPFRLSERIRLEPSVSAFNVFNFANFGGPGAQLNGVLDGSPGTSLNNASSPGFCGMSTTFCTSRQDRVVMGSGTYGVGAPRQIEYGVKVTF